MKVTHHEDSDYKVVVQAPEPVKTFTLKTYQRTCASEIQYPTKVTEFPFFSESVMLFLGILAADR